MRTDINRLSDDATIWIFGITPAIEGAAAETLMRGVNAFLDEWTAHGAPVLSAAELREGSFLVVAAEKNSETSGCSIDRMFGLVRQLEAQYNVAILDAGRVFYRDDSGRVAGVPRAAFRDLATPDTRVFDTTAQRLGDVRSGGWERRAGESWHRNLLAPVASQTHA